jgi:hypothetical protein
MRRIELIATITEDGLLTIPVPADLVPGAHAVIVEIDERTLGAEQRRMSRVWCNQFVPLVYIGNRPSNRIAN